MHYLQRNVIFVAALAGGSASTYDLEHNLNALVGSKLKPAEAQEMVVDQRVGGKPSLYEFHSRNGQCTVLVAINPRTQVIEGWRYQSGSKRCRKTREYDHAW